MARLTSLVAGIVLAATLTACAGDAAAPEPPVATTETGDETIDILNVTLPNGDTVQCVRFWTGGPNGQAGGLSCDWDGVK